MPLVVKSNDDLRQEMFAMQLIKLCQSILHDAGLKGELWLRPYTILSTGPQCGLIECLTDCESIDALKRRLSKQDTEIAQLNGTVEPEPTNSDRLATSSAPFCSAP